MILFWTVYWKVNKNMARVSQSNKKNSPTEINSCEVTFKRKKMKTINDELNQTINPFTEKVIDSFNFHTTDEAKRILNFSHKAFQIWKQVALEEKKTVINEFSRHLKESKDDLANLMTTEMGKPIVQSHAEIQRCLDIISYSIENAQEFLADKEKDFSKGKALVTYQPQGVILGIQPWNFPLYQALRYTIPNLLAGNTVLLKHAKNVWGTALMIEKLFEKTKLTEGAFRVLKLKSNDTDFLYESSKVRGVTFTGSSETGSIIAKKAGENLKKTVLELGGNDAYIVLDGADLESTVDACIKGRLNNNGQTCICAKRFLVEESIYDQFKEMFMAKMKDSQVGDPFNEKTDVGPMAREDLLKKLHDQVTESIKKGANCILGGRRIDREGYFYEPTILEDLKAGMPAYDEELFGPVASLIKVKNVDEAIEIANSSKYGLGGGIFGANEDELVKIAKSKLDTGMVNVNGYGSAGANMPFGGVKASGYGREFSHLGFHEFVNIKSIMIHR